jgi:hypothetical protein
MSNRRIKFFILACAVAAFAGAADPNGRAWAQAPTYKIVDRIAPMWTRRRAGSTSRAPMVS